MTTERLPNKPKAGQLPCGHPMGWMLRLRDGPELYKYCWGCMIEILKTSGLTQVHAPKKKETKKEVVVEEKEAVKPEIKNKPKKTVVNKGD